MIYSLRGKVEFRGEKFAVINVAGVGYKVFCAPETIKKIVVGQEIQVFTHLHLKEDAIELYGFLTSDELELFETLNGISGIGPKTALLLSSLGPLEKLKNMMESGKLPPEIKGIGQKKMQKILLELTGRIKQSMTLYKDNIPDDALDALISLGFPKQKAKEAISRIPQDISDTDKRVQEAIKILGSR